MGEKVRVDKQADLVGTILLLAFALPAATTYGDAPSWGAWVTEVCRQWVIFLPIAFAFAAGYRYGDRVLSYVLRRRPTHRAENPGGDSEDGMATG